MPSPKALKNLGTLLRNLFRPLPAAERRAIHGSAKSVRRGGSRSALGRRATTQERAATARNRAVRETLTDAPKGSTSKGFVRRHPVLTGLAGAGTLAGAEFASPTFLGGESLTDKISDLISGESPEKRAESLRVAEDIDAQETLLLQRVKDAELEKLGQGELEAVRQGIDPTSLSKGALRLLSRRDAGTRLFGTAKEGRAILSSLLGPEGQAPISFGLTNAEIKRDLGPEIPLLRFLSAGERSRLSDASRSTGPTFSGGNSSSGVRQALEEAVTAGGLGR